ncbi:MAG: DNA adenine methylase [Bacteroidaceae bacterium]|nr:DNA adenine methylase [Bacteroidaceae bacterium]
MNYGLPYQGSKSGIARWVVEQMPAAETFVDLFAGGCAVTHAAMLSGKYRRFLVNDVLGDVTQLFIDAVSGKFDNETRWISREDFFRLKDTDPYIRLMWSFANNQRNYLYSEEIEPYKRALHYAVMDDEWEECRQMFPESWERAYNALKGVTDLTQRRLKLRNAIIGGGRNTEMHDIEGFQRIASLSNAAHREQRAFHDALKKKSPNGMYGESGKITRLQHEERASRLRGGGKPQTFSALHSPTSRLRYRRTA